MNTKPSIVKKNRDENIQLDFNITSKQLY